MMQAKDHHHRTDRRTRDKEASEAPHQLCSLTPNYPEFLQRYSDAHDDATFDARRVVPHWALHSPSPGGMRE